MSSLTTYNGLQVLTPEPSASAGKALNDNFKALSTYQTNRDPTSTDDQTLFFTPGSRWLNTTSGAEWICISAITDNAVWQSLSNFVPVSGGTVDGHLSVTPPTYTDSSGTSTAFVVSPTYNQTGTAGNIDFQINRVNTSTGSGSQYFINCMVSGNSKFSVDTNGNVNQTGNISTTGWGFSITNTGDEYGGIRLSLQNRTGVNGIMIENLSTSYAYGVADVVFKPAYDKTTYQRNIRYESRSGNFFTSTAEFQIGRGNDMSSSFPTLAVGDSEIYIRQFYTNGGSPSKTPPSGGYLFICDGALYFKGSSGTVTKIANA